MLPLLPLLCASLHSPQQPFYPATVGCQWLPATCSLNLYALKQLMFITGPSVLFSGFIDKNPPGLAHKKVWKIRFLPGKSGRDLLASCPFYVYIKVCRRRLTALE
jgi:hypothetical protein